MERHSKKDAKQQKIFYKNDSTMFINRQAQRQLRDLEEGKYQQVSEDPIYRKAKKFWTKCDEKYFKNLSLNDLSQMRQTTTSNQILGIGSMETVISNYRQEMIESILPSFQDSNKLKIFFKNNRAPFVQAVGCYDIQGSVTSYHNDQLDDLSQNGIKIKNMVSNSTDRQENLPNLKNNDISCRNLRLNLSDYTDDPVLCKKIDKYRQIQNSYGQDIDKQIAIWQWQLKKVNQESNIAWNQLIAKVKNNPQILKIKTIEEYQKEINHIQNKLLWATVLRSFEAGFKDKTRKMLQIYIQNQKNFHMKPPKGLGTSPKKYFETDCKICFCSDNNDSNQVLYCDSCNTSYHLACYGLNSIPKQDPYYCERCAFTRKQGYTGVKAKNIHCQICSKNNYPMKRIDNHFYHVTCLILFNLVQFNDNKMELKSSLNHQKILDLVIENEMISEDCDYCRKPINNLGTNSIGMKIKCSYDENCMNYYHPICAYLNGCKFIVNKTIDSNLQTRLVCNSHFPSRNEQVYLRRYMLNVNDASTKNQPQFQKEYQKQCIKKKQTKQSVNNFKNHYPNRILYLPKFIKSFLKSKQDKDDEKIQTETQILLRKIRQNKVSSFI